MKKLIAVIVIALVIVGGAYWISGMVKKPSTTSPVTTGETNMGNSTVEPSSSTTKGPFTVASNPDGKYLADKNGMTLYVNLADTSKDKISPACNATCENNWIPYLLGDTEAAPEQSGDSILSRTNLYKRPDGKYQFALGTQLLYRYVGDKAAGEMKGASIVNWAVARP